MIGTVARSATRDGRVTAVLLVFVGFVGQSIAGASPPADTSRVIVVVVEGLGNWVLDDADMHTSLLGFRHMQENGVRADYVLPEFITERAPNFHSMFTGGRDM